MKRVSAARAKQRRQYIKLHLEFLMEQERCFVCGKWVPPAIRELHHFYGRVGRLLCWKPGFRMAGIDCHSRIHTQPKWAIENGYLAPMGCFNDFDRAVKHHNQKDTK